MGSFSKAVITAFVVLSIFYPQANSADSDGYLPEAAESCEVVARRDMKHPSSREYVGGPWPRFVKKMLA